MQDLCNTMWSLAKLGVRDEPLVASVSSASMRQMEHAIPQNLSNLVWSHAVLLLQNGPLFDAVGAAVHSSVDCDVQDLTNTVWSFATCRQHTPLFASFGNCVISMGMQHTHKSVAAIMEWCFSLVSVAWVYAFMEQWPGTLRRDLQRSLAEAARVVDQRYTTDTVGVGTCGTTLTSAAVESVNKVATLAEPRFALRLSGIVVIFKPPGWEVDGPHSESNPEQGKGFLSEWVQRHFDRHSNPVPHISEVQYGFIHRLDIPSSGLVLAGTTFEGLYSLRLQINLLGMRREYVVACHGVGNLRECRASIDVNVKHDQKRSQRVNDNGKPAVTWFRTSAHCQHDNGDRLTMTAIRIHTGRNHQIRTHLLHCSLPTVVDGKYSCRDVSFANLRDTSRKVLAVPSHQHVQVDPLEDTGLLPPRLLLKSTSGMELKASFDEAAGSRRVHPWSFAGGAPTRRVR